MSNFGVDLLLESQKANIKNKNDILVILMHWMICKNNLRNVGVGDNKIYCEEDRPSELLPEGWNEDGETYRLRYTLDKKIYIFYAHATGDSLLVNLLDATTQKTESLIFDTPKIVKATKGATLDDFVTDSESVFKRVKDEIVDPLINKKTEEKKQTEPITPSSNPLLVRPSRPSIPNYYPQPDPLFGIGGRDLNPLGGGGGMLFDPFRGLEPRGGFGPLGPPYAPGPLGIPPGARYDPPNPLRRLDPDNDHHPPPGMPPPGYDDMFM